jgi:hypothetical protein
MTNLAVVTDTTNTEPLAQRAFLVNLKIRRWGAEMQDRDAAAKIAEIYGADAAKSGKYTKFLVDPDDKDFALVKSLTNAARTAHTDKLTLPWIDNDHSGKVTGDRLLPATNYDRYMDVIGGIQEAQSVALAGFLERYPAMVVAAANRLGGMFDPDLYPSVDDVAARHAFKINVNVLPSDNPHAYEGLFADVASKAQARTAEMELNATKALQGRLVDVLQKTIDGLKGYSENAAGKKTGVFRDSLITNLIDVAELVPALNVSGLTGLDDAAAYIEQSLTSDTAADLREHDHLRAQYVNDAQKILDDVADLFS